MLELIYADRCLALCFPALCSTALNYAVALLADTPACARYYALDALCASVRACVQFLYDFNLHVSLTLVSMSAETFVSYVIQLLVDWLRSISLSLVRSKFYRGSYLYS